MGGRIFVSMQGYVPQAQYDELKARHDELKTQHDELKASHDKLAFRLEDVLRMLFGAKRERFIPEVPPNQMSLFAKAEQEVLEADQPIKEVEVPAHTRQAKPKNTPKRLGLPLHLERQEVILQPQVDTTNMVQIGEEVTETLDYRPAKLVVIRTIRPKFVLSEHKNTAEGCTVHIASVPERPINKCIAEAALLAIILIEKFIDHLPLYRQQRRFIRLGMNIPRSTLCGWVAQSGQLLEVLYNKVVQLVLQSQYIQADETTIKVLEDKKPKDKKQANNKKGKTHQGYYWAFYSVSSKLLFFRYDKSRAQTVPYSELQNFSGTLQADGYSAYEGMDKLFDIILANCWAHARRKFEKALSNDKQRASHALLVIQKLYAIERQARKEGLNFKQRQTLRQQKALPILTSFFQWMDQQYDQVLPQSPIGKALAYSMRRKKPLMQYLSDGEIEIDNNLVENAMRPIALGRKNYLFAGSHQAAQRAAIFYSLFACCKNHGIDPYVWLVDVLKRLPTHPINRVEQLLPHLWKPLQDNQPSED